MAEVSATVSTYRLCARYAEGPIATFADRPIEGSAKRWPGAVGIELGVARKELGITYPAVVGARFVNLAVLASERGFSSALSNTELLGAQTLAEF